MRRYEIVHVEMTDFISLFKGFSTYDIFLLLERLERLERLVDFGPTDKP